MGKHNKKHVPSTLFPTKMRLGTLEECEAALNEAKEWLECASRSAPFATYDSSCRLAVAEYVANKAGYTIYDCREDK